jgi:high-affinity nickel permease
MVFWAAVDLAALAAVISVALVAVVLAVILMAREAVDMEALVAVDTMLRGMTQHTAHPCRR